MWRALGLWPWGGLGVGVVDVVVVLGRGDSFVARACAHGCGCERVCVCARAHVCGRRRLWHRCVCTNDSLCALAQTHTCARTHARTLMRAGGVCGAHPG